MGYIRVVPGVLDDGGRGGIWVQSGFRQGKGGRAAAGQADGHWVGEVPGQQTFRRCARGGGGAGTGCPATTK